MFWLTDEGNSFVVEFDLHKAVDWSQTKIKLKYFHKVGFVLPVRENDCYTAFWDCMDGTVVRHLPEIRPVHKATAAYKLFIYEKSWDNEINKIMHIKIDH